MLPQSKSSSGKHVCVEPAGAVGDDSDMLEKTPLYKLKSDFKGIVIRASLEKIWIENGVLHATISLWQLTTTLAVWAVCLVFAVVLAFGLIMSPDWGLAAIAVGSLGS